jgi:serine/threonine-protein kinase
LLAVRDRLGLHAAVPSLPDQETQPLARPAADTLVVERHREPTPVAQAPSRRRRRGLIALILVVVAAIVAGIGGWYLAVDRYTHAPGVISLTRTAAEARLHKAGLHAKWLPDVFSDSVASGRVAYESPGPNEKVRSGGTVALALSKGADAVPDVTNLTPDQATAQLRDNQLSVSGQTRIYSDTVRSGHVVRTDPPVGTHVAPGSSVRLFVSKGAAPVKLPDVTGKSEDDARSTLTSLGLTVTVTRKYDDKVRSGLVISTTPPAGTSLHKGDPVTVVVSRGPKTYPVPDVINMKIRDAIRVIREAGFNPDPVQSFPGGPGRVFRESPPGGSQQPKGTTIELDYY